MLGCPVGDGIMYSGGIPNLVVGSQLVGYPAIKLPCAYVAIGVELVYTGGNCVDAIVLIGYASMTPSSA